MIHERPSRLNTCANPSLYNWQTMTFETYLSKVKSDILSSRCDLTPDNQKTITEINMPFELNRDQHNSIGIILIHGLLESPFTMRDLGEYLGKQGFFIRSLLLTGHGTHPADLRSVSVSDWISVTKFAIEQTRPLVDKLFILGFSGGGSLALYHALENSEISGVITLAPSFELMNKFAYFSKAILSMEKLLSQEYWIQTGYHHDEAKYAIYPPNLALQARNLTRILRNKFKEKKRLPPWQLIVSMEDETVSSKTAIHYFNQVNADRNALIVYSKKMPTAVTQKNVFYRTSQYPSEHIVDFSHICLPISPSNPRYGIKAQQLKDHENSIKGAMTRENLKAYPNFIRLTYNPDFEYMSSKILAFILEHAQ
jgi:esterase/lipase